MQAAGLCSSTAPCHALRSVVFSLHLGMQEALQDFRRGKAQALVAEQAAASLSQLPSNVKHVVHFDAPQCPASYIRSAARTGPLASEGQVLTFLTLAQAALAQPLLDLLQVRWACDCDQGSGVAAFLWRGSGVCGVLVIACGMLRHVLDCFSWDLCSAG